jgi:dTDP-4-amino-4,6-dideoxygalactose transaminase
MIYIAKPTIGPEEKQAVMEVMDSGIIAQGPKVKQFEEAFAAMVGVKEAVATSSGTTALHTMLLAHGIGPGDEVITTPFTFIASANSILYTGAKPVFVDIDPVTFNIDPNLIEAAITPKTKAIMPVHLFGLTCDMAPIMDIADRFNLVVLEDAAQSHGAKYFGKQAGSFGSGAFSLYPTKNMTSAEGGMVTTNDSDIAESCRVIRQHGMRRRYYHDELGFNFRMTDIHAAIGLEQIKKLDDLNSRRQANAKYLTDNLRGVITPVTQPGYDHVYHQYTIRVPDERRNGLMDHLQENGIGYGVYYPIPIHKQIVYCEMGYNVYLPVSEQAALEVLSLPVHPSLTDVELETIVSVVNSFTSN